jgi:hypothetical protein
LAGCGETDAACGSGHDGDLLGRECWGEFFHAGILVPGCPDRHGTGASRGRAPVARVE